MVSASHYEPWKVFDLIAAIGLAIYAFAKLGRAPSPADVALGVALFVAGIAAMYSLFVLCAAASFWVVRLDNLMYLLSAIFDTARWPIQVLPGIWRVVFTFIIPVAIMTTFPAMALLGTLTARAAVATGGGALAMVVISRLVWTAAIRSYTSASS
jgi:ABC-2 type transport system permease protein